MARITGVDERRAGLFTRLAYWFTKREMGRVPEPLAVTAHNPWIFRAYSMFEFLFRRAHRLDERLKVLAEIKSAALVGCPF